MLAALAVGAVEWSGELGGILAGVTLLFAAGLVDDLRHLSPLAKLAAQIAAAVIVLASGLEVEIVGNDVLAWGIGLLWLVGITNAFNLLDNMDGLAATLAAIACAYFAIDAVTEHESETVLVLSLALGLACAGFLPFNLAPGGRGAVHGRLGSQVLGFGLASLALASSWTVAGTTTATILLPLLILAVPILDTTLVTLKRLAERRPVTQGGRDHTSHRLVYYGLSEAKAVLLLALVAAAIGATALAYNVLDNGRLTALGVLVTFVLLVQFASFLSDLEERSRAASSRGRSRRSGGRSSSSRAGSSRSSSTSSSSAARSSPRTSSSSAAPARSTSARCSSPRSRSCSRRATSSSSPSASTGGCGASRPPRRLPIAIGCAGSAVVAYVVLVALRPIGSFPAVEIFVVDAVLATLLVGASRLTLRLLPGCRGIAATADACSSSAPAPRAAASRASSGRARRRASSGSSTTTRACAGAGSSGSPSSGARTRPTERSRARGRRRSSSRSRTPRRSGSTRSCAPPRMRASRAASCAGTPSSPPEPVEASLT